MTEQELKEQFLLRQPALTALGNWVTQTIIDELVLKLGSQSAAAKFLQIPPKPRVKEVDSFLDKLIRKPKANPFDDINDQVGVRFVVLLLEDIDLVCDIVQSGRWEFQKDRDFERERLTKPDYFAYQSDHFVIRTQSPVEFRGVTIPVGYCCEIQIRTILQHAYAEMAHSSDYKPSIRLPGEEQKRVKRALAKGSALIETTDDVFREIKTRLNEYSKSIDALRVRASNLFKELTGVDSSSSTQIGNLIVDTYREWLKNVEPKDLDDWVASQPQLRDDLKLRHSVSVFFRDPSVIILGFLISQHEMALPQKWPLDRKYLDDFYTMLGIANPDAD